MKRSPVPITKPFELDGLRTYLEGKIKRLNLLFAVNGGAFAIATLPLKSDDPISIDAIPKSYLAAGAIIFTVIMAADTWLWAHMMKRDCIGGRGFRWPGQLILTLLALLPIAAWSYAGLRFCWIYIVAMSAAAGAVGMFIEYRSEKHATTHSKPIL